MYKCGFFTWKALARALAPSFSRRFLPAINTLSLSGAPRADDCLWHSIRASARIYTNHTAQSLSAIRCKHVLYLSCVEHVCSSLFFYFVVCLGTGQDWFEICFFTVTESKHMKTFSMAAWLLTFPPPIPMPQLLSLSSLRVWQDGLFSSCSIPFTPSGPKALSLRSSSVSLAPALINPLPKDLWWKQKNMICGETFLKEQETIHAFITNL